MKEWLHGLLLVPILALIVTGTIVIDMNTIDPVITPTIKGERALTVTGSEETDQDLLILKMPERELSLSLIPMIRKPPKYVNVNFLSVFLPIHNSDSIYRGFCIVKYQCL